MKTKYRTIKIFTIILLLAIFFTIQSSVSASSDKKDYSNVRNYAQNFMKNFNSDCTLDNPIKLYNFQNNVQALFFSSKQGGYIIVNLNDYSIPEFSPENFNKFIGDKNKKYFYNGALAYFEENNNEIIDSKTKEKIGLLKNLKSVKYPVESNNINLNSISNSITTTQTYSLKNQLPNYSYNPDGRCTITAATMLLAYYAKYVSGCEKYVLSKYLKSEKYFSNDFLYSIIQSKTIPKDSSGNPEGIDPAVIPNSIKNFVINYEKSTNSVINFHYKSTFNINSDRNTVINLIKQDKPIMLDIINHPPYVDSSLSAHEVTAWGYSNINNNEFFMINDGWGNDFTYVSPQYVHTIVY